MRIDRTALIQGLLGAANRERERRQAVEKAEANEAVQRLHAELDRMAERRRAAADFVELSAEEKATLLGMYPASWKSQ